MNFELGKEYIVRVTEQSIIPTDEFDRERFFDKDCDSLDFLTDEEKEIYIKKGQDIAWECARKLCQLEKYGGLEEHCAEIFNRQDAFDVFEYSASEAIAKIKEYEEKQKQIDKIKVGDEVFFDDKGRKAVVSRVLDNGLYNIVFYNGDTNCVDRCFLAKSGRYFPQIAEVLEQMKGGKE